MNPQNPGQNPKVPPQDSTQPNIDFATQGPVQTDEQLYVAVPPEMPSLNQVPLYKNNSNNGFANNLKTKFQNRTFLAAAIVLVCVIVAGVGYGGYHLLAAKPIAAPSKTPAKLKASAPTKPSAKSKNSTHPAKKKPKTTNTPIENPVIKPPSRSTAITNAPPKTICKSYCYLWVGGRQFVTASGVSVQFGQARPKLASTDYHTLVELAVMSTDGQQIVEVGWLIAPDINGDSVPRLFVYHWVAGQKSCYNACGYVQVSGTTRPGDPVAVGATGTYKINYSGAQWQIFYNGTKLGYFPESLWGGRFTKVGFTETFGEVAARSTTPCTQMGNGIFGSSARSLLISHYSLLGSSTTPYLSAYNVNNFNSSATSFYNYGAVSPTSLRIGGPGSC